KHGDAEQPAMPAGTTHGEKLAQGGSIGGKTVGTGAHPSLSTTELLEDGERHMQHALLGGFAWLVALGAGLVMYMDGYAVANVLMKIAPLRWLHTWLYRRMYFDELYFAVFVAITMGLSRFSAAFDKYVVDGLVNLAAWVTKQAAFGIGANDQYVVDGA